jgi:hypothetical protein
MSKEVKINFQSISFSGEWFLFSFCSNLQIILLSSNIKRMTVKFFMLGPPFFSICVCFSYNHFFYLCVFLIIIFSIRVSCRCGQTNFLLVPQLLDRWLFLSFFRFFLFICLSAWSSFFTLICLSLCLTVCLSIVLSTSQSSTLYSHSWTPSCPTIFSRT